LPKIKSESEEKISVRAIMDVPEEFGDPQKEAEEWYRQENLATAELIYEKAQRMSEEVFDIEVKYFETRRKLRNFYESANRKLSQGSESTEFKKIKSN